MSDTMQPDGKWKAPSGDGEILISPGAKEAQDQALANQKNLANAHQVRLSGISLPEIRRWMRKWLAASPQIPLIGDGHQVELSHPGVWAKIILIDELAKKLRGQAYHFSVDTDAPKHFLLKWPGGGRAITDDPRLATAKWTGMLDAPTPQHLQSIERELREAAKSWGFEPMALDFLSTLKRLTLDYPRLVPLLISALHELDWKLGLRHTSVAVEPMWNCEGYLICVHHLAARAGEFAADYNAELHDYRREQGIHSAGRPWPDLVSSEQSCELPFWLDCLESGERLRATVKIRGLETILQCPNRDGFVFKRDVDGWKSAEELKKFLVSNRLRLSPRALALTMFLRLIVCDGFVHGIGGALYDEITDRVIRRRLKIDSPAFCVTTATLLFPSAAGRKPIELQPLLGQGRRLRHGAGDGQKMQLVRQIETLPRKSPERARIFYEIHSRLSELHHAPQYQQWETQLEQARKTQHEEQEFFDRELFYGLQPKQRLMGLIERYQQQFR